MMYDAISLANSEWLEMLHTSLTSYERSAIGTVDSCWLKIMQQINSFNNNKNKNNIFDWVERKRKNLVIIFSQWREYGNGVLDSNRCNVNTINYYLTSQEAK